MTKEIIQKVSEIMELAVNFNSSATMQELTDDKPTFFVVFSGLICGFEVRTNINGYPEVTPRMRRVSRNKKTHRI